MSHISDQVSLLEACWKYLVLGLIQGLTEFLPISSTAHLKAIPMLFGWGDPGVSDTAVIQLGSVIAVIIYFRKDLYQIIKSMKIAVINNQWREENARLGVAIITGTIPIIVVGILIKLFWSGYNESIFRSIPSIGLISILMAFLLGFAEQKGTQKKILKNVSGKDGLIVGLGQVLAILPGTSRSGITLTTALMNGWKRQDAARFSFLVGIPAISFAGIAEIHNAIKMQFQTGIIPIGLGIITSIIVSLLAINWLLIYLERHKTWIFVIYRLIFGLTLLWWWWGSIKEI